MGYDGTLKFDTKLDTSGFAKGISEITGISQKGYETTTKAFLGVTGAVAGIGTAAVKTVSDFDAQMSRVSAISGATGDDFDDLRAKAREMGAKTKFSATESAEAMEYMAMAGWKTEDMLNGIEGVMHLAAASGEDLSTTSDIVTDAMTAFGLSADKSSHFADVLAAASTNANTNVGMLGYSFKYVAPVAGALGMSVEDVSTALGLMANSGIKSSMAGTALRNILTRMAKPTKESQNAMDALGLSLTDDEGRIKSLNEIMLDMREGFSNCTEAQKAQYAAQLAGQQGMSGLLAIVNSTEADYNKLTDAIANCTYNIDDITGSLEKSGIEWQKYSDQAWQTTGDGIKGLTEEIIYNLEEVGTSAEDLQQYLMMEYGLDADDAITAIENVKKSMEETTGAAETMANTMNDNLYGQLTILKSSVQELAISVGDALVPTIRKIVSVVQDWTNKFNGLDQGTKELIVKIGLIVGAVGPVLLIIAKVVTAVTTIIGAISGIAGAIGGLITALGMIKSFSGLVTVITTLAGGPLGLIAIAIGAVAAAFIYLWNTSEGFRNFWINLWNTIKTKSGEAIDAVKGFISSAVQFIKSFPETVTTFFTDLKEKVTTFFTELPTKVAEFFTGLGTSIVTFFAGILEKVTTFFTELPGKIAEFFTNLITSIMEWLTGINTTINDFMTNLPYMIGYAFGYILGTIVQFGIDVLNWITTTVPQLIDSAIEFLTSLPGRIWEWLCEAAQKVKDFGADVWDYLSTTVPEILENVVNFFKELPGKMWECLSEAIEKVIEWGKETYEKASEAISDTVEKVVEFFKELPGKIWEWLTETVSKVVEFGGELLNAGIQAAQDFFDQFIEIVTGLPDQMFSIGQDIITGVWNGICDSAQWFWDSVTGFFSGIVDGAKAALDIGSPSKVFRKQVGRWIPPGVGEGVEEAMPALRRSMKDEMSDLVGDMQATVDAEASNISFAKTGAQEYERAVNERINQKNVNVTGQLENDRAIEIHTHVELDGNEVGYSITPVVDRNMARIDTHKKRGG